MKEANRVVKNTLFLYIRMGISMFVSLFSTRLVLAALGVVDFGIFNVVGGTVAMLTFINAAMTSASQRFMSYAQGEGNSEKQNNIFNISVSLHTIIGFSSIIIFELAGLVFFKYVFNLPSDRMQVAKLVYHFMVLNTFFTIISVPYDAVINARENMLFIAIIGIIEAFIKLAIALIITYTSIDKLILYSILMTFLSLFILVARGTYCTKKYREARIVIANHFKSPLFKEMTSFAGWSFLGYSSNMVATYGQNIVINSFFGTKLNAAHGISNQVSVQLRTFASEILKALNPLIAKSAGARNRDLMLNASITGSKISSYLLILFYVPVIIETPYILSLWLKEVPDYSIIFCRLTLIHKLIEQPFWSIDYAICAEGNIKKYQIFSSILHFLPIIIAIVFFIFDSPPYSIYIVFIIMAILKGGNIMLFAKYMIDFNTKEFLLNVLLKIVVIFSIGLLISSIPSMFLDDGFIKLFTTLFLSFCVFITMLVLYGLTHEERNYINENIVFKLVKIKNKFFEN